MIFRFSVSFPPTAQHAWELQPFIGDRRVWGGNMKRQDTLRAHGVRFNFQATVVWQVSNCVCPSAYVKHRVLQVVLVTNIALVLCPWYLVLGTWYLVHDCLAAIHDSSFMMQWCSCYFNASTFCRSLSVEGAHRCLYA
jgi:hypothetical protein